MGNCGAFQDFVQEVRDFVQHVQEVRDCVQEVRDFVQEVRDFVQEVRDFVQHVQHVQHVQEVREVRVFGLAVNLVLSCTILFSTCSSCHESNCTVIVTAPHGVFV